MASRRHSFVPPVFIMYVQFLFCDVFYCMSLFTVCLFFCMSLFCVSFFLHMKHPVNALISDFLIKFTSTARHDLSSEFTHDLVMP